MSEPCRLRRGEGYGVCDDEAALPLGEPTILCSRRMKVS